jgi:hypothetical protein
MESVREARVCRRSRCCGASEQTLRLLKCRPLCGQSHTCARNPALCAETTGEGSNFARNGGDVFADKPMWRFSALPLHRESAAAQVSLQRAGPAGDRCLALLHSSSAPEALSAAYGRSARPR